jgi:hypothetical protein
MPPKKKGLFPNMPRRDRLVLSAAAFVFMAGQIAGALLKRFGYDWLAWL